MSEDIMNGQAVMYGAEARRDLEHILPLRSDNQFWAHLERAVRSVAYLDDQIQRPTGLSALAESVGMDPGATIEEIARELKDVYGTINRVYAERGEYARKLEAAEADVDRLAMDVATERDIATEHVHALGHVRAILNYLARMVRDGHYTAAETMALDILDGDGKVEIEELGQETAGGAPTSEGRAVAVGWPVEVLMQGMVEHLKAVGIKNYVEYRVHVPAEDGEGERVVLLNAQWADKKSSAFVAQEQKVKIDEALKLIDRVVGGTEARVLQDIRAILAKE